MKKLGEYPNNMELEIKLSKLRASNIEFVKKGNLGNYIGINFGELGEIAIYVNEKDYNEAKQIFEQTI